MPLRWSCPPSPPAIWVWTMTVLIVRHRFVKSCMATIIRGRITLGSWRADGRVPWNRGLAVQRRCIEKPTGRLACERHERKASGSTIDARVMEGGVGAGLRD